MNAEAWNCQSYSINFYTFELVSFLDYFSSYNSNIISQQTLIHYICKKICPTFSLYTVPHPLSPSFLSWSPAFERALDICLLWVGLHTKSFKFTSQIQIQFNKVSHSDVVVWKITGFGIITCIVSIFSSSNSNSSNTIKQNCMRARRVQQSQSSRRRHQISFCF